MDGGGLRDERRSENGDRSLRLEEERVREEVAGRRGVAELRPERCDGGGGGGGVAVLHREANDDGGGHERRGHALRTDTEGGGELLPHGVHRGVRDGVDAPCGHELACGLVERDGVDVGRHRGRW